MYFNGYILFTKELIMKNRYLFDFEITEEDIDTVLTEYLVEQTIARALDYCISEELSGEEWFYNRLHWRTYKD